LAQWEFAPKVKSGKQLGQSGCFRLSPGVTRWKGAQPGQFRDKSWQRPSNRSYANSCADECAWISRRLRRRRHLLRNKSGRRTELEAERAKLQADVEREIDLIVADMHAQLPRHRTSYIGVAYARYSTEFQHSVSDQIRGILEFAVKNRILVPREHVHFDLATRGCKEAGRQLTSH
jgi:hypothetical protein